MLKIGEFSKLSRVSVRMLRHYDEIGLLPPASIDSATGYRYYSEDQLPVAGRITALRDIGFGLGEIQACQQGRENPQVLAALFSARREALRGELAALRRQLRLLDTLEQRLRKEDSNMEYPVNLKTLPQRQVASVRMTIPAYDQEGILWHTLVRETEHLQLQPDDPCYCTVTFHDGEYKETDVDVEAQKTVRGTYPDTEHVVFKTVPPVTFASVTFQGPYDKIQAANAAVAAWVRDNGYVSTAPLSTFTMSAPTKPTTPRIYHRGLLSCAAGLTQPLEKKRRPLECSRGRRSLASLFWRLFVEPGQEALGQGQLVRGEGSAEVPPHPARPHPGWRTVPTRNSSGVCPARWPDAWRTSVEGVEVARSIQERYFSPISAISSTVACFNPSCFRRWAMRLPISL